MSTLHLTGTLTADARLTTGTDGSAWLLLDIGQSALLTQAQARWHMGKGFAAQYAAGNAARRYRRGCGVCVHADAYDIALSPEPHLVLLGIRHVFALDVPAARQETEQERAA